MENAKVRQGLIAAILKKDPEEIQKTKLMPTILRKEYPEDKYGILDVRVLLKNGEQMDLEMQVVPFEFWFQRSFYYLSKMVTDQMKTGDTYDRIKPCIHVGILDFNFFENDTRCYHAGMFCDKETGEVLTDLLQIHILELKKLPPESHAKSRRPQGDSGFFNSAERPFPRKNYFQRLLYLTERPSVRSTSRLTRASISS